MKTNYQLNTNKPPTKHKPTTDQMKTIYRYLASLLLASLVATYAVDVCASVSEESLINIHSVGDEIAKSIVYFFELDSNRELVAKMLDSGIEIQHSEKTEISDKFAGQSFVFTGSLQTMTRDEAQSLAQSHGGRATLSVTKKTSYVVVGKDPGYKYDKAISLGVEILTEDEFLKLVNSD